MCQEKFIFFLDSPAPRRYRSGMSVKTKRRNRKRPVGIVLTERQIEILHALADADGRTKSGTIGRLLDAEIARRRSCSQSVRNIGI